MAEQCHILTVNEEWSTVNEECSRTRGTLFPSFLEQGRGKALSVNEEQSTLGREQKLVNPHAIERAPTSLTLLQCNHVTKAYVVLDGLGRARPSQKSNLIKSSQK